MSRPDSVIWACRENERYNPILVQEWAEGGHTFRIHCFGSTTLRLTRWKGSRRVASSWRYSYEFWWGHGRGPVITGDEKRAKTAAIIEEMVGKLQPDDPITALHDWVSAKVRPAGGYRHDLRAIAEGKPHCGSRLARGGECLDHAEWYRDDDRRLALAIGHNYGTWDESGKLRKILQAEIDETTYGLSWLAAPEGVSWYYPGRTTAMLFWSPRFHPEFGPELAALTGQQIPEPMDETTFARAVVAKASRSLGREAPWVPEWVTNAPPGSDLVHGTVLFDGFAAVGIKKPEALALLEALGVRAAINVPRRGLRDWWVVPPELT